MTRWYRLGDQLDDELDDRPQDRDLSHGDVDDPVSGCLDEVDDHDASFSRAGAKDYQKIGALGDYGCESINPSHP